MLNFIQIFLFVAFAVSSISLTISKSKIFMPLRMWARKKNVWLGRLLSCPYCVSHWTTFAIMLIYQFNPIEKILIVDQLLICFSIIGLSAIMSGIVMHFMYFEADDDLI